MEQVDISLLPECNDEYALTADQVNGYQEKGHIFLKHVATRHEILCYEPLITEWVMRLNNHDKPVSERDTYGKAFIQVGNLWETNEACKRFILARRFAKIAADLMEVEGVRIYHDQALFKEPGGGHTPWHQDQIYWPLDSNNTITMWMPLVSILKEVGTMTFASGTHKLGYVSKEVISDESHKNLAQFIDVKGIPTVNYGAMDAGDATFHSGWTMHCAPGNPTNHMRKVLTVIYVADGVKIANPDSKARENDLKKWFPGCKPGDFAASSLNPIVYKKNF